MEVSEVPRSWPPAATFVSFLGLFVYGKGRWREMKAIGRIRLPDGTVRDAEIHWGEEAGIGRKELKIKRYLELP